MPEATPPGKKPENVRLDQILTPPDAENFTEATVKYEAPGTRQAREACGTAAAAYKHLFSLLKFGFAGVLLLAFSGISMYVLFLKPNAAEVQRFSASTVLTAIASGAGYAFGKKPDKPDKEQAETPGSSCCLQN